MKTFRYPIGPKLDPYEVIDGDTIRILQDKGNQIYYLVDVRILGVDTPEPRNYSEFKNGALEKIAGILVSEVVKKWMKESYPNIDIISHKVDKYGGRINGDIINNKTQELLSQYLMKNELSQEYVDGPRTNWTDEKLNQIIETSEEIIKKEK